MNRLFAQFLIATILLGLAQSITDVKFKIKGQPADRVLAVQKANAFKCVQQAFNPNDKAVFDAKGTEIKSGACSLKFSTPNDAESAIQMEMSGADNVLLNLKKYDFVEDKAEDPDCAFVTADYIEPYKKKCDEIITGDGLIKAYEDALLKVSFNNSSKFTKVGSDNLYTNKIGEVAMLVTIVTDNNGSSLLFKSAFFSNSVAIVSATQKAIDEQLNDVFQVFAEDAIIMNDFMANKSDSKTTTRKCSDIKTVLDASFKGDSNVVSECTDEDPFAVVQVGIKAGTESDITKMISYQKTAVMGSSLYDTSKIIEMIIVNLKRDKKYILDKQPIGGAA